MTKDEIKAGDRINTPKGMGTVKCACGGYLTVMLDNGEWWVDMNAILPKEDNPTDEIKVGDRVKFKSKEELETMLEPSFWWGIPLLADKEAEIINIPFEDNYRVDIDPSLGGIRREFFDKIPKKQPYNTIIIPVKADFGEDVGFALLDRALELQKKHTELEGEIKRLYELVSDAMNGLHPLRLTFDNSFLSRIACMVCCDFRPLTAEEKAQFRIDIKNMADNLKKQSDD